MTPEEKSDRVVVGSIPTWSGTYIDANRPRHVGIWEFLTFLLKRVFCSRVTYIYTIYHKTCSLDADDAACVDDSVLSLHMEFI